MANERTHGSPFPADDVDLLVAQAIGLVRAVRKSRASCAGALVIQDRQLARQSQMLYEANDQNSKAVEAALYSAVFELSSKRMDRSGINPPTEDELGLAFELVRVAYNRAQRAERQADRLKLEAARGEVGVGEVEFRPIQQISEKSGTFSALIRELLDGMYGDLDAREHRILECLSQGMDWEEVALLEGVHRTTISRVVKRISDRLQKFLNDD